MEKTKILRVEYLNMSREEKVQYLIDHGELNVLTTYTKRSWDDIQMDAHFLGCMVTRRFDPELRAAGMFCDYYHFVPKN